jgi:hypothetical protein
LLRVRTIHNRAESIQINAIRVFPSIKPDSRGFAPGAHAVQPASMRIGLPLRRALLRLEVRAVSRDEVA